MKLENQVAVVTGAARGIGLAIAEAFVREGADVMVADLDGDAARGSRPYRLLGPGPRWFGCRKRFFEG